MKRMFLSLPLLLAGCGVADFTDEPTTTATALAPCGAEDLDCPDPEPPDPGAVTCSGTTTGPPAGSNFIYRCDFDVSDSYGRLVANQVVEMEVRWCSTSGTVVRASASGVTGANGHALLTTSSAPGNQIYCRLRASEPLEEGQPRTDTLTQATAIATNTVNSLTSVAQPAPTLIKHAAGRVAGDAELALFQAGAYDRAMILVEPFDPRENDTGHRERTQYWKMMRALMVQLYANGWDVWLFQPRSTGDNLHEQSAELAQAIKLASRYAFCGGTVSVFGFNTGGVVARLATARWEADPAWRTQLGLPRELPVKLLGTGDSPNYGMHLNLDMQKALWDSESDAVHSKANLDSCAAAQLLRGRWHAGREERTNEDFLGFWVNGTATMDGACEAGPALATLNAARGVPGWPTTPLRVGFASSEPTDRVKCYRDSLADWNLNANGDDLCTHAADGFPDVSTQDWTPTVQTFSIPLSGTQTIGDVLVKIDVENGYDRYWRAEDRVEWSDLTPGSRSPLFVDGDAGRAHVDFYGLHWSFEYTFEQRAPSTMIPYVSAKGTQGPVGTNPYATVPNPFSPGYFADLDHSGIADVVETDTGYYLLNWLNSNQPTCPGPVLVQR